VLAKQVPVHDPLRPAGTRYTTAQTKATPQALNNPLQTEKPTKQGKNPQNRGGKQTIQKTENTNIIKLSKYHIIKLSIYVI
jgi:hypothetical protein